MAQQAGVRAIFLAEALGQICARNVNLMRARLKEKRVDDARHMTGNAPARFRASRVMRMSGNAIPELVVTAETHLVRVASRFQRRQVVLRVRFVR